MLLMDQVALCDNTLTIIIHYNDLFIVNNSNYFCKHSVVTYSVITEHIFCNWNLVAKS